MKPEINYRKKMGKKIPNTLKVYYPLHMLLEDSASLKLYDVVHQYLEFSLSIHPNIQISWNDFLPSFNQQIDNQHTFGA